MTQGARLTPTHPLMYDARTLKPTIRVTESTVECPVLGCSNHVERQRNHFRRTPEFLCASHRIYISASTHEYADRDQNLLSRDAETLALLETLTRGKRESGRLGRERSEDALTFNVFRALERSGRVDVILSQAAGHPVRGSVVFYWALDSAAGTPHPLLAAARAAFGERPDRGTEPDLLIESDDTLCLVEAKLGATNETVPTHASSLRTYAMRADRWFETVFASDVEAIALRDKRYQLMRLWLLGSWMAARVGKRFVLVSLGPAAVDGRLDEQFGSHLVQDESRRFVRYTWDAIARYATSCGDVPELAQLAGYLAHKTLGYDTDGSLRMALPPTGAPAPSLGRRSTPALRAQPAIRSLHVLRNRLTQTRELERHCEWVAHNFAALVSETRRSVQVRGDRGYRTGGVAIASRMDGETVRALRNERGLEQELYARFGPATGCGRVPVLGRIVAYQLPLFNERRRNGWGHIDLVGLEDDGVPVVIELKQQESRETPLRCLLEVVANAIAVQENWRWISAELAGLDAVASSGIVMPTRVETLPVVLLAPSAYWRAWEPDTSAGAAIGAAGYEAFQALCRTIAQAGFPVRCGAIELPVVDDRSIRDARTSFAR